MLKTLISKNTKDEKKKIERRNSFNILVTYLGSSKDVLKN